LQCAGFVLEYVCRDKFHSLRFGMEGIPLLGKGSSMTNTLDQHTVRMLCSHDHIPQKLLDNANADLGRSPARSADFSDPRIGDNLHGGTVLSIAEQLLRFRVAPDLLGLILCGTFGQILSGMMISALGKAKKRRKKEFREGDHVRTKWQTNTSQRMWAEAEVIQETALAILHGATDNLRLMVPWGIGEEIRLDSRSLKAERVWRSFSAYDSMSGEELRFASYMDQTESDLLEEVVSHNQGTEGTCSPNEWQFCLFPARTADHVCDLFQDENIITIRRVKSSLSSGLDNCVIGAFGAAAFRFMQLEFGHNTELPKGMTEISHTYVNGRKTHVDSADDPNLMVPIMWEDEVAVKCSPLQKRMVEISLREWVETPDEVWETLCKESVNPISRATFWRHWTPVIEMAKNIGED